MVFFTCTHLYAQNNTNYTAKIFGTREGLPSADINCIMQDSENWLWIGHSLGCSRYDGYRFTNFIFAGNQPVGIVYNIQEDDNKIKWIASEKGLFWSRHNSITYVKFVEDRTTVFNIFFAPDKTMWLSTSIGPVSFSREEAAQMLKGAKVSLNTHLLKGWNTSNIHEVVKDVAADDNHGVYISTEGKLYYYNLNHLQVIWSNRGDINDYVMNMYYNGNDSLFFTTSISGLHSYIQHHYKYYNNIGNTGVTITKFNNQFYYTNAKSVNFFLPHESTVNLICNIAGFENKWVKNFCIDNENNFWIATNQGLELLQPMRFNTFTHKDFPEVQELYSILQLKDNTILMGSNRGKVYKYSNGRFARYPSASKQVVPHAEVFSMYEDDKKDLWFATGYEGISVLTKDGIKNYNVSNGLRDNSNFFFIHTERGLFTGGDYGITLFEADGKTDGYILKNYRFSLPRNNYTIFKTGIEAEDKTLWLGSNMGLFHFYKDSLYPAFIRNLENIVLSITDMQQDKYGNVWISTLGHGLLLCRFKQGQLELQQKFDSRNELRSDIFLKILIDKDENIWAASYDGIIKLEAEQNSNRYLASFYTAEDGFIRNDYQRISLMQDNEGTIWAASSNGIVNFKSFDEHTDTSSLKLYITGIQSADSDYYFGNSIDHTLHEKMNFNARNNNLTISYAAIHLSNPKDVHYLYRLEGIDSVWVDATNERTAIYHNLPTGNYIFEVKASAGNNQWTSPVKLSFEIFPPFWKRWWFLLFAALFIATLIFYLLKLRVRSIKRNEAQKTDMEKIRAMSYEYQLEIEQVINYFATSISGQKNMDDILWDIAKNCISKLGFEDCVIYLKDDARNMLMQKAAWGPKTSAQDIIINPIEIPVGKGIVGTVALTCKPEIINDTSLDERYIVDDERRFSEIAVPIINNGQAIGVIDSEHSSKNFYTDRHLQILTTIASLCADKIDKVRAEQQTREKEIELIKLNSDLATSQLTALRSQMNPHFIFNALNSVQQYILTGDVDEANKYLSKFSRLQREILHHCDQNFISLEKEIEMLNLYLQLEQLRFNEQFNYSVRFSDDIDPSEIKIPPMMLQPFVENAIWHGLMPKQGSKEIAIDFMIKEEQLMICTIKDNGIGREAAARMKHSAGSNGIHKSKGLALVIDRLDILKKHYQQTFEVSISDIKDLSGKILGTSVKLTMHVTS